MPAALSSSQQNVVNLADVRAERRLPSPPISLEMDWDKLYAEDDDQPVGRTLWFAIVVSSALWAVIAGALWFV